MKIYLIRHGQTDWNLSGKMQGNTDIELNGTGIIQAEALAEYMADKFIKKIYSSRLKRAVKTAEILGQKKNLEVCVTEGLQEICLGEWEGLTWEEISEQQPKRFASWNINPMESQSPGGESLLEVMDRSSKAIESILNENQGDIAVISHGVTIDCILRYLFRENPEEAEVCMPVSNASVTILEYSRFTKDIQLIEANISTYLAK